MISTKFGRKLEISKLLDIESSITLVSPSQPFFSHTGQSVGLPWKLFCEEMTDVW